MQEESLSLQGLHPACQICRRAMWAGICLRQQGCQLVNVQPPVMRQVISDSALSCRTDIVAEDPCYRSLYRILLLI